MPHKQQTVSHVLHLLVSVFTLGIWLLAWAWVAVTSDDTAQCVKCGRRVRPL